MGLARKATAKTIVAAGNERSAIYRRYLVVAWSIQFGSESDFFFLRNQEARTSGLQARPAYY